MALVPTDTINKQPEAKGGLFSRILNDPGRLQMILYGLGLMGSKRRDQADRYIAGLGGALQSMAERKANAGLLQAQTENLESQSRQREQEEARKQAAIEALQGIVGTPGQPATPQNPHLDAVDPSGYLGGEYDLRGMAERLMGHPELMSQGANVLNTAVQSEIAGLDRVKDAEKELFGNEAKLRKEYTDMSKEFVKQRDAYARVVDSAKDASAAGDMSLIFNYMKILDPGSTVREGEYANARNAGGILDTIRSAYNSAIDGRILSHKQRADFVDRATRLYEGASKLQTGVDERYRSLAEAYGADPSKVVFNQLVEPWQYPAELLEEDKPEARNRITRRIDGVNYYSDDGGETWFQDG